MVTCSTPATVPGLTGNLQGTYKLLSLAMGKKAKQHTFTPYPMPDLVIRKVKALEKLTALPGSFDFTDSNGILIEWNEEVDKFRDGLSRSRNLSSIRLLPQSTQEWYLGGINPSRPLKRNSYNKAIPKMPWHVMPILSHHSMPQE